MSPVPQVVEVPQQGSASGGRFDGAVAARHFGLLAALVVALVHGDVLVEPPSTTPGDVRFDARFLGLIAGAAVLNLALFALAQSRRRGRRFSAAAPYVGIVTWGLVILVTGGLESVFVFGLAFEILLSVVQRSWRTTLTVSAASIGTLFAVWLLPALPAGGVRAPFPAIVTPAGVVLVASLTALILARRWRRHEHSLLEDYRAVERRLEHLEDELARASDADVGRLAHGLKNGIHSLRGLVALLESKVVTRDEAPPLLEALHDAIDQLEELSRLTLDPERRIDTASSSARNTIPALVRRFAAANPTLRCHVDVATDAPAPALPAAVLSELLEGLLQNAADALAGTGTVQIAVGRDGAGVLVAIRDDGPGVPEPLAERIFERRFSTKRRGTGLGLWLARRVAESHGGSLVLAPGTARGACFELRLPTAGESRVRSERAPLEALT